MRTIVRKWEDSLGLRIPSGPAEDARLADGTAVDGSVRDGRLVVTPVATLATLAALVARVTPENLPALAWDEDGSDRPRGAEAW